MTRLRSRGSAVLSFLALTLGAGCGSQETTAPLRRLHPPDLEELLRWLPADTETVVVGRSYQVDSGGEDLEAICLFPVVVAGDGYRKDVLAGATVRLSVGGARRFRPPTSLGLMRSEGCTAILPESPEEDRWTRFKDSVRKAAVR